MASRIPSLRAHFKGEAEERIVKMCGAGTDLKIIRLLLDDTRELYNAVVSVNDATIEDKLTEIRNEVLGLPKKEGAVDLAQLDKEEPEKGPIQYTYRHPGRP